LRELDKMAVRAASDEQALNTLIEENRAFILKCASGATHRYITQSDDEWSLALFAFNQAVKTYDPDKGGFLSYAQLIIIRRLTDYYKSQSKYRAEIPVSPHIFSAEPEEDSDEDMSLRMAVAEKISVTQSNSIKDEIEAANLLFSKYGFTFYDLADCSPKASKTKKACAAAVIFLLDDPLLLSEMRYTRQLPIKAIEANAKVPRKILDRHRKYIIAAAEILSGEYPCLAEYMQSIRKELSNA